MTSLENLIAWNSCVGLTAAPAAEQQQRLPPEAEATLQRLHAELAHSQAAYNTVLRALHRKVSSTRREQRRDFAWRQCSCPAMRLCMHVHACVKLSCHAWFQKAFDKPMTLCRLLHADTGVRVADRGGAGSDGGAGQGLRGALGAAAAVGFFPANHRIVRVHHLCCEVLTQCWYLTAAANDVQGPAPVVTNAPTDLEGHLEHLKYSYRLQPNCALAAYLCLCWMPSHGLLSTDAQL